MVKFVPVERDGPTLGRFRELRAGAYETLWTILAGLPRDETLRRVDAAL